MLLLLSPFTLAAMPDTSVDVSDFGVNMADLACWAQCEVLKYKCEKSCSQSTGRYETNEWGQTYYIPDREAYGQCTIPCIKTAGSCRKSCDEFEWVTGKTGISQENYKELEGSCDENSRNNDGCCEGYEITELGVCCSKGYDATKNDNGVITCGPKEDEFKIESVKIDLDDTEFVIDYDEELEVTFTFSGTDEEGNKGVLKNTFIGTGFGAKTDLGLSFDIEVDGLTTDNNGQIDIWITLSNINTDVTKAHGKTFNVFHSAVPDTKKSVKLLAPEIDFKVIKLGEPKAWHDSWATYEVRVSDPAKQFKRYTIDANQGSVRINGKESFVGYESTKSNTLKFGWKAPKVSQEVRMQYNKRMMEALLKSGLILAEDLTSLELDAVKGTLKFDTAKDIADGFNKGIKVQTQKKTMPTDVDTSQGTFGKAAQVIDGVLWMEGTVGLVVPPSTVSYEKVFKIGGKKILAKIPLVTALKMGGTVLSDWYKTVEQMEKIAQSTVALQYKTFDVTVEVVDGAQKPQTITVEVPVEGYELLLGED